jgi:hypothetical protein
VSTVQEIKEAAGQLSVREQWELSRWLAESVEVRELQREELRREIAIGVAQADRGELRDAAAVFERLKSR